MNLSRLTRLLQVIGLLQAGRGHNVDSLAQSCEVSRRTDFRDLDMLKQAGVPLVYDDEQQRYRIPSQYFLPPTNFTAEEALAVLVLCHELGDSRRLPFYTPARSAALKLESALPARLREQLRDVTGAVQINLHPASDLDGKTPVYEQLVEAIRRHRSVRIRYDSLTEGHLIHTRLDPYRLLFSRHSWYVVGRSSLHRSVRTFHVGRIVEIEPLSETFHTPRGFSIERYLGNAWHLIPEPGPDVDVLIRFQKLVARNVAEVGWHKTQQTEFNPDGTLDFRVTVSGLNEISWWVLGYGDQAEVIWPQKLRQLVAQRAAGMLRQYADDGAVLNSKPKRRIAVARKVRTSKRGRKRPAAAARNPATRPPKKRPR